jgi:hypothetical protein
MQTKDPRVRTENRDARGVDVAIPYAGSERRGIERLESRGATGFTYP